VTIIQNPRQFKVPDWMLNRKKDVKDGKFSQVVSNTLDMKLREDLERLKKIRAHRGLRHYCAPPPPESLPTRPRAVAFGPLRADGFRSTVLSPAQPSFLSQGACACVVSAPRRPAARAAPSVCPRRRARYLRLRCYLRHAAAARWQYCPSCVRVPPRVPIRGWAHLEISPLSSPLPPVLNTLLFSLFLPLSKTKISILSQRVNHTRETLDSPRAHTALYEGMLNSGHVAAAQWESIRTTVHVLLLDPSHIY